MNIKYTSLFPAMILGLSACGGGSGSSSGSSQVAFDATALINNEADNIITATYTDLNAVALTLHSAVLALQDGGATEAELEAAREAWKAAREPWEQSEGFLFGPVDSMGIDPAIDSWPLNTTDLASFIADNPNTTESDLASVSEDLRGFHAIEYLLFGDGVSTNTQTVTELDQGEINYLVAASGDFQSNTEKLAVAWTTDFNGRGPYAELLSTAGSNTIYSSQGAVVEELVNGLAGIADEVANAKMAEPFGTSAENADTTLVESQYSWNSLTDFHNNLQSILNAYTGKLGYNPGVDSISEDLNGVYAFVAAHDITLANTVLDEIIDAQQKIALIKGDGNPLTTEIGDGASPFRSQITEPAGRILIEEAIQATQTLFDSLDNQVVPLVANTDFAN